ncbi:unnamed protein product [Onchocerca flexuosa]|uniref:Ovule protein n=1 Tax=Onchocerca flexuosa TaxID=387005 RepID=A0A183HXT4_9BILA|nr:unnamed protein product [Onchocerca flexuosa]
MLQHCSSTVKETIKRQLNNSVQIRYGTRSLVPTSFQITLVSYAATNPPPPTSHVQTSLSNAHKQLPTVTAAFLQYDCSKPVKKTRRMQ